MPYGAIELYLMGLLPASQVPALWVMDDPVYEGPVFNDASTNIASMNFDVQKLHAVSIADIVAVHGARPAATQTAFRGRLRPDHGAAGHRRSDGAPRALGAPVQRRAARPDHRRDLVQRRDRRARDDDHQAQAVVARATAIRARRPRRPRP
jgi:hypothetical protein